MRRQDEVLVAVVLLQVVVEAGRVGVADALVVGELVRVVSRARVLASPAVPVVLERVAETVTCRGERDQVTGQQTAQGSGKLTGGYIQYI